MIYVIVLTIITIICGAVVQITEHVTEYEKENMPKGADGQKWLVDSIEATVMVRTAIGEIQNHIKSDGVCAGGIGERSALVHKTDEARWHE